ncbi:HNH endonuclease [Cupriavidus plantarum]|uniref:HNH endonuclease n=1 Tax=Cupriavidus plantarum TaxID=942865 RepID=UPI001B251724|nr:HNH endonuclease [Cupriavidus plantarum]CAG2128926.1 hypothetical protein LMG26296_01471 [Cupriavidus plantarum]SMR66395.1 HNH endonuclease [Cupriavidus plantarum]
MIPAPVVYEGKIRAKVDAFAALSPEQKQGSYWDKTDDGDLSDVKKHIKDYYIKVQDHVCPYCQQKMVVDHNGAWDAEHIIAKDARPEFMFEPENLCIACKDCNGEKSNKNVLTNPQLKRFPRNREAYLICHPHFDQYEAHLKVVSNPLFFIPHTDKGRRTIEICGLLRFLYQVSEYGDVPVEIAGEIGTLHQDFGDANSGAEQVIILSCIRELCDKGIDEARRARFAQLRKPQTAEAA